ncbi:hypothetical protein HDV00_011534 [Rhizophlyctis rosea]|nr:hypothetical protein HDV00_011534 [Rhizophlyctis rosea]
MSSSASPEQQPDHPTLTTINDDVLLAILQSVPLTTMYNLSCTCRRLHIFLRDTKTVIPLFRSAPPYHAMTSLAQFPQWAIPNNGAVVDAIVSGPKPPLFYVEEFMASMQDQPAFQSAVQKLAAKSVGWYPHISEDLVEAVKGYVPLTAKTPPNEKMSPSMRRFSEIFEDEDEPLADNRLQQMLEEELFPLGQYFRYIDLAHRKEVWYDELYEEHTVISHPRIQQLVTFSDVLPRLGGYFAWTHLQDFIRSLYARSSPAETTVFQSCVRHQLETTEGLQNFANMLAIFPNLFAQCAHTDTFKVCTLRHAIRTSTLLDCIEPFVASGAVIDNIYLLWDLECTLRNEGDLKGWCKVIAAFQRHRPVSKANSVWCKSPQKFDIMMRETLEHAERAAAGVPSQLIHPPVPATTDYFVILESFIREGEIEWRPTVANCVKWVEGRGNGYRHRAKRGEFQPDRLIGLLEWLMDEREKADAEKRRAYREERKKRMADGAGDSSARKKAGKRKATSDPVVNVRRSKRRCVRQK